MGSWRNDSKTNNSVDELTHNVTSSQTAPELIADSPVEQKRKLRSGKMSVQCGPGLKAMQAYPKRFGEEVAKACKSLTEDDIAGFKTMRMLYS